MPKTNKHTITTLILLFIVQIIAFIASVSIQTSLVATLISNSFYAQNTRYFANGDSFALAQQLNTLSSNNSVKCLFGTSNEVIFYEHTNGICEIPLITKSITLFNPNNDSIKIKLHVSLPSLWTLLIILALALQFFIFSAFIYMTITNERQKNKIIEEYNNIARVAAHDIRAPLAALSMIGSQTIASEYQEILNQSIARIEKIAADLLTSKKTSEAKLALQEIVNAILVIAEEYRARGISITIKNGVTSSQNESVCINTEKLGRIISNILNNSVEAIIDKKLLKIEINIIVDSSFLKFEIFDNGSGIPPSVLKKLGKTQITSKKEGHGIGLSTASVYLNKVGGSIAFDSDSKSYTKVTIKLPITD